VAWIEPACEGEILGNENLCIDGTVEGLVYLDEQKLTVGATAKLTADVIAGEVIVYGTVKGNVHGRGKIEIKKDGSVNGDLTTAQIIIEDGAYFKGSIAIEKSAALQTEITQDAISKAERIMGKIDARWPGDKVPGKL